MEDFKGYALVMVPTDRIKPYSLLLLKNSNEVTEAYTSIDSIFKKEGSDLPVLSYNMPLNMNENIQLNLKADVELKLLEGLLKFIGSHVSAEFKYDKTDIVNIKLIEPKSDAVNDMAKVDGYINNASLFEEAASFIRDLKNDRLFMVTEILKCNNFIIENTTSKQTDANAGTEFKSVADANAGVASNKNITASLSYSGDAYLTVGLKAWRIFYDKNFFGKGSFRIRTSPDIKMVKGGEEYPGEKLESSYIIL